ncbi:MAG: tRNA (adenosine(37)-N6)-threonylcarbamoyltransferase complex dimerization subunit type 1 TsaB [Deltaproteobacteria bacterium]|nr:tRNA (adenosine(37)-N6)-threonylcarbamoyltransferase complex dimerization subunit type 1 TsaB [Deltaproteobacteria bacterium]
MATLLVIDTATLQASVAVVAGAPTGPVPPVRVLGRAAAAVTTHSETLLSLVAEALRQAGLGPAAVDAVGCGAGPGSFTGLRIGLCTAKGLCYATGRPLVMASSLRALALGVAPGAIRAPRGAATDTAGALVGAVLDAKKGEVYCGFFRGAVAEPVAAEVAIPPAAFAAHAAAVAAGAPLVLCGSGVRAYPAEVAAAAGARLLEGSLGPDAVEVGRLCLERLGTRGPVDLATAAPTYMRPSEAEVQRRRRGDA